MPLNQAPATAIPRPPGALEKLFWLADQNRPMHSRSSPRLVSRDHATSAPIFLERRP